MRKIKASWDRRVKLEAVIEKEVFKLNGKCQNVLQLEPEYGENISIFDNATSLADIVRKMRREGTKGCI